MWFSDDTGRKKRGSRKRKTSYRRRPVLVLNAQLKQRRKAMASNAGVIAAGVLTLVAAVGVTFLVGRELRYVLFSGNDEYQLTNFVVNCESPQLTAFIAEEFGVEDGVNIFMVDIDYIQSGAEMTANVKSARVSRHLPGTLKISVSERVPLASLGNRHDRARRLVVDEDGVVFNAKKSRIRNLPTITGYGKGGHDPGSDILEQLRDAVVLIKVCRESGLDRKLRIESIDLDEGDFAVAQLLDGPTVKLKWVEEEGKLYPVDLEERLQYLCGVILERKKMGKPLWSVDLTAPNYHQYTPARPL